MRGLWGLTEACRALQLGGRRPAALLSTICNTIAKRFEASCSGGCRPRCGSRCQDFGRARPCRALRRPPRPLAPLRCAPVSLQVQKCAVVVLVQCNGNVCWSVHRGRARACARARVCVCAAQGLPDEPTRAGNGPPVPELCNHRTWPRARGHPPSAMPHAAIHAMPMAGFVHPDSIHQVSTVLYLLTGFAHVLPANFQSRSTGHPRT